MNGKYYKETQNGKVYWLRNEEMTGEFIFSFDKETNFNLFRDYPHKLTKKQKKIFDAENPFWVEFFADRSK